MNNKTIEIQLNGKKESVAEGATVLSLLEAKSINPHVVACELNLKIIKRAQLREAKLMEGDTLEVIQMVGGG